MADEDNTDAHAFDHAQEYERLFGKSPVRFSVHAAQKEGGVLFVYVAEEPNEDVAKARANRLWASGMKHVVLSAHTSFVVAQKGRRP